MSIKSLITYKVGLEERNHSTTKITAKLSNDIANNITQKNMVGGGAMLIDFSKAFDMVDHTPLKIN